MGVHREWLEAAFTAVNVYPPDDPEHPDEYVELPLTGERRWAIEFTTVSESVVIDGDPHDLSDLLARAVEQLLKATRD